jgi:flagellar biosynthesis/type III secretory pathway protein FliH
LRAKYAPRLTRLEEQIRRAEQTHARESEQLQQQKMQSAISMGATLLGAFLGGRRSAVGRATTAARGLGRSRKEARDVERAGDNLETAKQRLQELESEFQQELAGLKSAFDASTIALATRAIRPKKAAVAVRSVQLAWAPHWQAEDGSRTPGWA